MAGEMVRGFRRLHFVGPCVTVFGSARTPVDDPDYATAREVARSLAQMGFTIMTGGGPGIMEAANRGARDVGGVSVGCNIRLPHEQQPYAFVVMPGGFGTLDETFEALTLIQTAKIHDFPVVVMGSRYWAPLREQLDLMVKQGTITATDLDLLCVTDDGATAVDHVQRRAVDRFGLHRRLRPRKILGEHAAWNI